MRDASFAARVDLRPGFYLLVALVALLVAPGALAGEEMDVRKDGSPWARLEKGGAVRIDGVIVGEIEDDGTIRVEGRIAGRIEEDGEIREDGTVRTRVEKDGTLRRNGTVVGRIEEGGAIRRHGRIWGESSPCCTSFDDLRRLTALLLFFDRSFFVR